MSLPSIIQFYNSNDEVIAQAFINVGWIMSPDVLADAIRNSVIKLENAEENDKCYSKNYPEWVSDISFAIAYGYRIPIGILKKIVLQEEGYVDLLEDLMDKSDEQNNSNR